MRQAIRSPGSPRVISGLQEVKPIMRDNYVSNLPKATVIQVGDGPPGVENFSQGCSEMPATFEYEDVLLDS